MSLNRQMGKGALWMLLLRFFNRGIGLISTLILVRLLLPEDFGLVAMATALVALVTILGEMSVNVVLVQKHEIDDVDLNSAWSLRLLISLLTATVLAVAAIPVATLYSEPRLELVVYVLAAGVLMDGFSNIGPVLFQRDLKLHLDFLLMGGEKLAAVIVGITLAFVLRSYWAMVAGILTGRIAHIVLSYSLHSYRPSWSRERWSEIFRFSRWLLLNNALFFLNHRSPDLILGKVSGPTQVGIFSIAYEISMLPTTDLVAAINRAVLPGYSRMRDDPCVLRRSFLDVGGLIALLALPAALGVTAVAALLVPVMFGQGWAELIPLIALLGLAGAISCLLTNTGSVYLALGRPRVMTALTLIRLAILLPGSIYGASNHGAIGVALAYVCTVLIMLPLNIGTVLKTLEIRVHHYVLSVYRPALSSVVMYLTLTLAVVPWLESTLPAPIALLSAVAVGALCYLLSVLVLWAAAGRPYGAELIALRLAGERIALLRARGKGHPQKRSL